MCIYVYIMHIGFQILGHIMNKEEIKKGTLVVEFKRGKLTRFYLILKSNERYKFLCLFGNECKVYSDINSRFFKDDITYTHKIYNNPT